MTFDEILSQVLALLQRQGRLSYRALKVRFQLDDDLLEALKDELIYARRVAIDEAGRVLVWLKEPAPPASLLVSALARGQEREPLAYTPQHLAEKILHSKAALEGERKQVTVFFCDLANSTALATRLGPETMHILLNRFFELALNEVHRYEGTINQFLGDGFMALFGAPIAQEDHARRAVLAALDLQHTLREHHADLGQPHGVECMFRMGLNTGLVVVGSIGDNLRMDYTAVGDTTNLTARLQEIAEPGTILISDATRRQVQGAVRLEALPPVQVKGKAQPIPVYRAIGRRPRRSPLAERSERTWSQFAGREHELTVLEELLAQVEAQRGQVVGIVGDAGVGKSRLLYEFRQRLAGKRVTYLEGRCLSYGRAMPYYPFIEVLRHSCGLTESDSPEAVIEKVHTALQEVGMEPAASAPYLLQLLGMQAGTEPLATLTPETIKTRTFAALKQMSLNGCRRRPLVLAIEDLHWSDKTSEEFCTVLVESLASSAIMVLATYRPGYGPPWIDKAYVTQLALQGLAPHDGILVVRSTQQRSTLSEPVVQMILDKAEGNPFFLEELTHAVVEQGELQADLAVPDTVQGVLMARIDRLPEAAKRLLQTAAVLGRDFSRRLLEAIWDDPGMLEPLLQELQRLEFLYARTGVEEPIYIFKHALTQEVAYEALLTTRRQALHAAAGRALERLYGDRLEDAYDRLAYHYARTNEAAKAVEYLTRLARRATRGAAHAEALAALQDALAHAERLPAEQRDARVIDLVMRQARCLTVLGRLTDARDRLLRAQGRLARLQDLTLLGPYHFLLGNVYSFLGEHASAIQSAQKALEAATGCRDTVTMSRAYYLLAFEAFWTGQYRQGIAHSYHAITLLEQHQERGGLAYWIMGITAAHMGAFDEALQALDRAQTIGEALDEPHLQGMALHNKGMVYAWRDEREASIAVCQRGLALSTDPLGAAIALGALGMAYLEQGAAAEATPLLERSVQELGQIQHRTFQGWVAAFLSEAYRLSGQLEQARELALQELVHARGLNNWFVVGMVQRVLGRIAYTYGQQAEAATHLQDAVQVFAAIQARFEVGRTHLDLAILTQARGRQAEAAAHLRTAHALFTELRVSRYVDSTAQLARELGVPIEGHNG